MRLGRLIIGRTFDNDLQMDSKFISRHHCQIITTAEGSVLEDLNSTNGVYVKSKRVRKHHLNDGDVIVLGKHEIMYLDERSVRSRATSTRNRPAITRWSTKRTWKTRKTDERAGPGGRGELISRPRRMPRRSGASGSGSRGACSTSTRPATSTISPNPATRSDQLSLRQMNDAANAATPSSM